MRLRGKIAGLAALAGFLSCMAWSARLAPIACCGKSCDPCPILLAKSDLAGTSQKVDIHHALLPAAFPLFQPALTSTPGLIEAQIPGFLPHEFRRPMRN
jgi:hypothetical protein